MKNMTTKNIILSQYFFKVTLLIFMLVVAATSFAKDNTLTKKEESDGWELLFNGNDMNQWRNFKQTGLTDKWLVKDGTMALIGAGGGDILTKKSYKNFDLRLDWNISLAGNSGIFILADELGSQIYSHAIEIQILDNERHSDNKIDSHLSGSLYDIMPSPASSHKISGEWNQVRILMEDNRLRVWQNDIQAIDVLVGSDFWQRIVGASKFSTWPDFALSEKGHIGLQDHNDPVSFKNIKIKELL